jgi:hypothetical protein
MTKLDWRKQARRAFIPTMWIGALDDRDLFVIAYVVRSHSRLRRTVSFRLNHMRGESLGEFPKLADAKAYAEFLA